MNYKKYAVETDMGSVSSSQDYYHTFEILFILTVIQFWWIAIWGIAYIVIDLLAGTSKVREVSIYICMLAFTITVVHMHPNLLDRL
jgi:hypothetical protein